MRGPQSRRADKRSAIRHREAAEGAWRFAYAPYKGWPRPRSQQRATARVPDATIRCGDLPRVVFEVVSPSELRAWRDRDRNRLDLQDVEGVTEIVELYQDEMAAHVYRREPDGLWSFEAVGGAGAVLDLRSVGIAGPMAEIYEFADLPERG